MNKCYYCSNEGGELHTASIEIAGEIVKCLQCPVCKSVILKEEDIEAINHRYRDIVEEYENLQNEVDNQNRIAKDLNARVPDEDIDEFVDSGSEGSFESPR